MIQSIPSFQNKHNSNLLQDWDAQEKDLQTVEDAVTAFNTSRRNESSSVFRVSLFSNGPWW